MVSSKLRAKERHPRLLHRTFQLIVLLRRFVNQHLLLSLHRSIFDRQAISISTNNIHATMSIRRQGVSSSTPLFVTAQHVTLSRIPIMPFLSPPGDPPPPRHLSNNIRNMLQPKPSSDAESEHHYRPATTVEAVLATAPEIQRAQEGSTQRRPCEKI